MKRSIKKVALLLLCMCLTGETIQVRAAPEDYPAETDMGIVFHNDYNTEKPGEKEDKEKVKEETNSSQSAEGETKTGEAGSLTGAKSKLPQTGETGHGESRAGMLTGMLLAVMLGIWKQLR